MDKETLSHYGWIVILVLVLAVLLALASPFGTFIAGAIKSTTAGLFDVNQAALGTAGINVDDLVFENCDHLETEVRNVSDTYTGDTCCKACGKVMSTGETVRPKVPDGGQYTAADGTVYGPGEEMPEVVTNGDVFTVSTHHYKYTYETESNGWKVAINTDVVDKKQTSYGAIYTSINGEPITNMHQTFSWCTSMKTAPEIPDTVTNMHYTFQGCHELVVSPVIPDGVTNMFGTFYWCGKLTTASQLPSNLVNFHATFANCTSLKTYIGSTAPDGDFSNYKIPDSVTDMGATFTSCSGLTYAPRIPDKVTNLEQSFSNCKALLAVPDLSNLTSVTNIGSMFDGCKSLTSIGNTVIPTTVRNIQYMFKGCTGIVDASDLVIPSNVEYMGGLFQNCTALVTPPVIPENITGMDWTFQNCTSLTGEITINAKSVSTTWAVETFKGVDFEAQNITLIGNSGSLDTIGDTGTNYCRECNGKHKEASEEHVCHYGIANCQNKATCIVCGTQYGEYGACVVNDGVCTLCGKTTTVIETAHYPYAHSVNYQVLGTWDYSDAQSVTITITYHTENKYTDWCSIIKGTDYVAGSTYKETRKYLKTDGTIVDATGENMNVKFGGTQNTVTFENVDMLTGSVIFRSDKYNRYFYGVTVQITPNY